MNSEELDYLQETMARHGLRPVAGAAGYVTFEKKGVRVQADESGEAFEVQHGTTTHVSPSLVELAAYLRDQKL